MMNRIKMAVAALILACAIPSFSQPVTLESKWNEKTVHLTTTSVTSATFDPAGFGAAGGMILGNTAHFNGTDGTTLNGASVVSSTWTNIIAFDYSILAIGGTATMRIAQTIKMPMPRGSTNASSALFNSPFPGANNFSVPVISTSPAITIPASAQQNHTFRAQVMNPVFLLTNLSAAATYHLTITIGVPRLQ